MNGLRWYFRCTLNGGRSGGGRVTSLTCQELLTFAKRSLNRHNRPTRVALCSSRLRRGMPQRGHCKAALAVWWNAFARSSAT